jgi:hypothetical protein
MDEESIIKMFNSPGINSSGTRNPPEEWDFAGNDQLIDEESNQGRGFLRELAHLHLIGSVNAQKIFQTVTIPRSAAPNPLYCQCQCF